MEKTITEKILQESSPFFDQLYINYQNEYYSDNKFFDVSFKFENNGNLIICPLTIKVSDNSKDLCFFGVPFEIVSKKKLSENDKDLVIKRLKEIEKKNNINSINFNFRVQDSDIKFYKETNNPNIKEIYLWSKINLNESLYDIKKKFSKGHKSCLKINYQEISYKIVDFKNYKNKQIYEMQKLHSIVSKKKIRSNKTWNEMEKMIKKKKAFIIEVRRENILIGYSFFFHNNYGVYYFSACVLRKNYETYKNLNHKMILIAIEYSKNSNLKSFIIGRCKTLYHFKQNYDEKLTNIEKFKSSFGGEKNFVVNFHGIPDKF